MIPYIKDSWRGGISDESTRGVRGSFKYGYGLDIRKRRDSLSSGFAMSNIGNSSVVNDLIRYSVTARDGTTYAFGSAGSIYAIAGDPIDPVVTFVYNDENGAIKGAGEWGVSDGTTYLMWATATSIARRVLGASSDTPWPLDGTAVQDYQVDLIVSADEHPFQSASGSMMIGNGNRLALLDFENVFNPKAMNIRPGNLIKALEERDDYVLIGSKRIDTAEKGHIWSWITTALNWVQKKEDSGKGCKRYDRY